MIDARELYWAAGFIEGEGCFYYHPDRGKWTVSATQNTKEPLERLVAIFGGWLNMRPAKPPRLPNDHFIWMVHGPRAIGIAMTLYRLMSPRRQAKIRLMLQAWNSNRRGTKYRTHCPRGHEYSGWNVIVVKTKGGGNGRQCRTCVYAANARRRAEKKIASIQDCFVIE